jgi:tRNA(fMet)-specific endonuclease VapC
MKMLGDSVALDTNIAVEVLNDVADVVGWLGKFDRLFLPAPVIGELNFGARNSFRADENLGRLSRLIERFLAVDLDAATADAYGRLRLELKRMGRPLPENDVWIAAVCLQHEFPLATRDAHFQAVPKLVVVTP